MQFSARQIDSSLTCMLFSICTSLPCTSFNHANYELEKIFHSHYLQVHLQCFAFSALTVFIGQQEGHPAHKKIWGDGAGGHC